MSVSLLSHIDRSYVMIGALFAFLSVALGAFGAHALRTRVSSEKFAVYQTGVQYQMYHALALVVLAIVIPYVSNQEIAVWAGSFFIIGIVLFSGSLYWLTFGGKRALGAITPFGGLAFLIGWLLLFISAFG